MKTHVAFLAFSAFRGLFANPVLTSRSEAQIDATTGKLTEATVIERLLSSPHLMPTKTYQNLVLNYAAKYEKLQKRNPSIIPRSPQIPGLSDISGLLSGLNPQAVQTLTNPKALQALAALPGIYASLPEVLKQGSSAPLGPNAPVAHLPELETIGPSEIGWPNVTKVKVRYGPFRLPARSERNLDWLIWNMEGAVTNLKYNVKRPCEGECWISRIVSDLEFVDGKSATVKDGVFYHHTILFNSGSDVREATCNQPYIENIFMSGNERTMANFSVPSSNIRSAYKVHPNDAFVLNTELQNFASKEQYVWQTITYDIWSPPAQADPMDATFTPAPFRESKIVWLTIGNFQNPSIGLCQYLNPAPPFGESNLTEWDLPKKLKFAEHSKIWTAETNGDILSSGGHMHAGGTNVGIFMNYKQICLSVPTYGKGRGGGHSHMRNADVQKRQIAAGNYSNMEVEYIERISMCEFPKGIPLEVGDSLHMVANYDLETHKGVVNAEGNLDEVMGMSGVLIAFK